MLARTLFRVLLTVVVLGALPASANAAAGWNGFGAGSWPPGSWRPYAVNSPFNRLTARVMVHPNSARIVAKVLSLGSIGNLTAGPGIADTPSDYGHPTFWAQPTDPLVTLDWTGGGPGSAIDGLRIRVPTAARAAGGDDGHMTVVQPDGWEYDFWRAKRPSSTVLSFSGGGRTRIDGSGLNSGATAANFGNLAGMIRGQELAAGRIDHALFAVVRCLARNTSFGWGTRSSPNSAYVYPASHWGNACSTDSTDLPPMGARLKLEMTDLQISALLLPAWKKTILRALAKYGAYIGDTGGPGLGFMFESGTTYTPFGRADPVATYARSNGITYWDDYYVFKVAGGLDWTRYLRVLVPPVVL